MNLVYLSKYLKEYLTSHLSYSTHSSKFFWNRIFFMILNIKFTGYYCMLLNSDFTIYSFRKRSTCKTGENSSKFFSLAYIKLKCIYMYILIYILIFICRYIFLILQLLQLPKWIGREIMTNINLRLFTVEVKVYKIWN